MKHALARAAITTAALALFTLLGSGTAHANHYVTGAVNNGYGHAWMNGHWANSTTMDWVRTVLEDDHCDSVGVKVRYRVHVPGTDWYTPWRYDPDGCGLRDYDAPSEIFNGRGIYGVTLTICRSNGTSCDGDWIDNPHFDA